MTTQPEPAAPGVRLSDGSTNVEIEANGAVHVRWTGFNTEEVRAAVAAYAHLYRHGDRLSLTMRDESQTLNLRKGDVVHLYPKGHPR